MNVSKMLGGSPSQIASDLREFSESAEFLSSEKANLIESHPSKWVGVHKGAVRAIGESLSEVISTLRDEGIDADETIVRYISKDPKTLIL